MKDIDCVVHGNMELFEMIHQPDLWHVLGTGAYGKDSMRITTGGTVGQTICCASDNLVASGMYDIVMAIGFEKQQEGHTTGGITNMACPLWFRKIQAGALTGSSAYDMERGIRPGAREQGVDDVPRHHGQARVAQSQRASRVRARLRFRSTTSSGHRRSSWET